MHRTSLSSILWGLILRRLVLYLDVSCYDVACRIVLYLFMPYAASELDVASYGEGWR